MRLALYAEVDPNLVDGSAIWLVAVARMLRGDGCDVTVLLRTPRQHKEALAALDEAPGVTVVDPFATGSAPTREGRLSARSAVRLLEKLDVAANFDAIIVRGRRTARRAAANSVLRTRLAVYLTDFPQRPAAGAWLRRAAIARTLCGASLLLCQTPELADYLRRYFAVPPSLPSVLLPPVIDDEAFAIDPARPPRPGEIVRLAYIGKFAPAWRTLEMTALPGVLARRGRAAELYVAGNKFVPRFDPTFPRRMRAALQRPGVKWSGGLLRPDALRLAAGCHVGLSWRARELDDSLELSTKLIDYGAIGLPAVCNPTAMHRRLLGEDYPLFAAGEDEVVAAVLRAAADSSVWNAAREAISSLADHHRPKIIGAELAAALTTVFGKKSQPAADAGCAA